MASVLKVKDASGNWVDITAIKGEDGKSAYEQAKEGGFTGTEAEFIALLNGLTSSEDSAHYANFNNPHKVTAEQAGAIPMQYPTSTDLNVELTMGGNRSTIHCYYEITLNTPYKEGKTACTHGMVITNAHNESYGTQMCMPSGEDAIYVRRLSGQNVSEWVRLAKQTDLVLGDGAKSYGEGISIGNNAVTTSALAIGHDAYAEGGIALGHCACATDGVQLGAGSADDGGLHYFGYTLLDAYGAIPSERLPIATGSYRGTNTYGVSNPTQLTFEFVPLFVIVTKRDTSNIQSGGTFMWIYPSKTLNFMNNGSTYWCHPTLTDKTLSWYCSESAAYQLNSSNYDYDYIAWGWRDVNN